MYRNPQTGLSKELVSQATAASGFGRAQHWVKKRIFFFKTESVYIIFFLLKKTSKFCSNHRFLIYIGFLFLTRVETT